MSKVDEKKKRLDVYRLMCDGNHQYNLKVLAGSVTGGLVVLKRPTEDTPYDKFAPCHACHEFVLRSELARHVKNCRYADEGERNVSNATLQTMSDATLPDRSESYACEASMTKSL